MTDAQTWTTIGGMFTFMLAFVAVLVRMFGQNLDTRFDALTMVMTAGFEQVERGSSRSRGGSSRSTGGSSRWSGGSTGSRRASQPSPDA